MAEVLQAPEPKISIPEVIIIGLVMVLTDLIDLIPLAGDITDIVVGAPLQLYLFMKGLNGVAVLVSNVVELIPALQEIPTRTIAWGITVFIDRNPKLEALAEKIGEVEALGEGGAGGAEGAAVAEGEAALAAEAGQAAATAESGVAAAESAEAAEAAEAGGQGAGREAEREGRRPSEESTERGSRKTQEEAEADGESGGESEEETEAREKKERGAERRGNGEEGGEGDLQGGTDDKNEDYNEAIQAGNENPDTMQNLEDEFFSTEGPRRQNIQKEKEAEEEAPAPQKPFLVKKQNPLEKRLDDVNRHIAQRQNGIEISSDSDDQEENYRKAA